MGIGRYTKHKERRIERDWLRQIPRDRETAFSVFLSLIRLMLKIFQSVMKITIN